jgi:DNA damage-binding protein 1
VPLPCCATAVAYYVPVWGRKSQATPPPPPSLFRTQQLPPRMAYNYVVTAQPPTAVHHSVVGHFTAPEDRNLIVAQGTKLELFRMSVEGLIPVYHVNVYGIIATIELVRMPGEQSDSLFLSIERKNFMLLGWDAVNREFVTKANGDLADRVGKSRDLGDQLLAIDPQLRLIGMQLYDGLLKVVPIVPTVGLGEAFNCRMEELCVHDMVMLHGRPEPTLLVLSTDNRDVCHLKSYEIRVRDKELRPRGEWGVTEGSILDQKARLIMAMPEPFGGAIVVANETVTYYCADSGSHVACAVDPCEIEAYGYVDTNDIMTRFMLGDLLGFLYMLVVMHEEGRVTSLACEPLGQCGSPSTLSYLDSGVIFVGSARADSVIIHLEDHRDPDSGNYFTIREVAYTNLGPIQDFCVVDMDRQGQCQLVTCSGSGKDGSLRQVRNGIGINETASIELPGIQGMWALRDGSSTGGFDKYLVQSFVSETRVLTVSAAEVPAPGEEDGTPMDECDPLEDEGGNLEEGEIAGFDSASPSLLCANMTHDSLLQVTPMEVRLVRCDTLECANVWRPAAGSEIVIATCTSSQVVVAMEGCQLAYLQVQRGADGALSLSEARSVTLEHEIACLCCSPCSAGEDAELLAVGMWTEISVRVLRLPSLELAATELLGGDVIPRSVLIANLFEEEGVTGCPVLLCGLGDGQLFTFSIVHLPGAPTITLSARKKISLGTQPIVLETFRTKDKQHVFAACDRPTVVYSSHGKLLFSNVNRKDINYVCPFHCEDFPDHLALATEEELTIGTINDIQRLHIRTVPLHEHPRRICHQPQSRTFGVLTLLRGDTVLGNVPADAAADFEESYYLRVYDEQTFEVLDFSELDQYETALSIISTVFDGPADGPAFLVVGTAMTLPGETEPTKGRLRVYSFHERKLSKVHDKEVNGAVYTLQVVNGRLVAGINSTVELFAWRTAGMALAGGGGEAEAGKELVKECNYRSHILALHIAVRGDLIVVGDLMRSMSVLVHRPATGEIEEVARDFDSNWMTAVAALDDDNYIGAEHGFNFFTVRKNNDAATIEEQARLEVVGCYHVGEFINAFRHGSLVMQVPESPAPPLPPGQRGAGDGDGAEGGDGSAAQVVDEAESVDTAVLPTLLFGTVNGAIGVVAQLPARRFERFEAVQTAMQKVVHGVGGLVHADFRSFDNDRRTQESRGFVDGDLVELFLDLPRESQEEVVKLMNANDGARGKRRDGERYSVDGLVLDVEDIQRLH